MKNKIKQPIYKKHTVHDLFCPNCNIFISGNGSLLMPYYCDCGQWERDYKTLQFKLKHESK